MSFTVVSNFYLKSIYYTVYRHISFAWIAFYITYFMYIPINLIAQLKCQQTTDEEEDKFASLSEISKKRDIKLIKRLEHVSLGVEL